MDNARRKSAPPKMTISGRGAEKRSLSGEQISRSSSSGGNIRKRNIRMKTTSNKKRIPLLNASLEEKTKFERVDAAMHPAHCRGHKKRKSLKWKGEDEDSTLPSTSSKHPSQVQPFPCPCAIIAFFIEKLIIGLIIIMLLIYRRLFRASENDLD
uniref:Uncharacterized protein n=2 Tax=Parascaris univalens TaxID=6257 RepID=A0A915BHK0_PARUN